MEEQFTFFWNKSPFSQWHHSKFKIDGVEYTNAEQWMMAEKARFFNYQTTLNKIMKASHPREQKALGREVKGYTDKAWDKVARNRVYIGNYGKFRQNKRLLDALLATNGTTLVEASPEDRKWGIGMDKSDPRAQKRESWLGKNWLGEVLTQLRDDLLNGCVSDKRFL